MDSIIFWFKDHNRWINTRNSFLRFKHEQTRISVYEVIPKGQWSNQCGVNGWTTTLLYIILGQLNRNIPHATLDLVQRRRKYKRHLHDECLQRLTEIHRQKHCKTGKLFKILCYDPMYFIPIFVNFIATNQEGMEELVKET